MSRLEVTLDAGSEARLPGERVSGTVAWELDAPPESLEIRLFWYTQGRGDSDQEVVASETVPAPQASGWVRFDLPLPAGPYSFSGALISLLWALELVAEHEGLAGRAALVVGPQRREVRPAAPASASTVTPAVP